MKSEGLSLEQHIKVCEESGPRVLTLNLLSCLTEQYKTFSHELPRLILLENASKALMDTTVEQMNDFVDDWATEVEETDSQLREEKKSGSPGSAATVSDTWLNSTRVMDLDVSCPRSRDISVEELRRARDTFVALACIEAQQCQGPRKSTGLSSVQSMIKLLEPLSLNPNPTLVQMLPWMEAFRESQGLDWAHANEVQREIYNDLEQKLEKWEQRHPVILRYIDPPHVIMIPHGHAVPGLAAFKALLPAPRFAPDPVNGATGVPVEGLAQLAGTASDARWYGDVLRTQYDNGAGGGGTGAAYTIVSFSTTGAGAIRFH
jgi:hypothetical protein